MTIDQIKEQLSIQDVLAHYGYAINKNKHINCPFHDDKTPSMRVYEETNTVYCFSGNCETHGKSLDVIEFVKLKEGISKHKAILHCKKMLGSEQQAVRAIDQIWKALKKSLSKAERAKSYVKDRGLKTINIGYHSGQLHKGKLSAEAVLTGLVSGNKIWANQCLIFALKNALNQVVGFYGRSLEVGHFYQTGRCGLYPKYPSRKARKIILTETNIDAASLLQIKILESYENLALFGCNGLTAEHQQALKNCEDLA